MVNGFNGNGTPSFAGLYSGDLPSLDLLMGIIYAMDVEDSILAFF